MPEGAVQAIPAEFQWRVDKARAEMARANVDLLILDSGESLAWLSGFTVSETMYRAIFLPRKGEAWFVLRTLDAGPCREGGWISDIASYADDEDAEAAMIREVSRRGYATARIGVDYNSISWNPRRQAAFETALPGVRFVNLEGVTDALRWVKSPFEINRIAEAAAIADQTMAAVNAQARPGSTTREAAAIAAGCFLRLGADIGETGPIVIGRGNHEFLHGLFRTDALSHGDILHVELIPYVGRYGARMMRPIVIGGPTQQQSDVAATLIALQDRQIAAMRPGAIASDVDRIMREGALKAGLRDDYINVTAYTLGLYIRTPRSSDFSRVFLPNQHWALEENMVFHVYTTAQGLGFSETVVVTPEGGKRLTTTPRQILTGAAD